MSPSPGIIVVGSLNADLVVQVPRFPAPGETLTGTGFARFPGGKGANQAYAAVRLGGRVAMAGQVGRDDLGTWLVRHLVNAGVDARYVTEDDVPTGVALITVDRSGQNTIALVPGANGTFTPDRLRRAPLDWTSARVVLLQLEIPVETVIAAARAARAAGAVVLLDPAPARELPRELLRLTDHLTPNESELATLTGGGTIGAEADVIARAKALRALGVPHVLVKCGAQGAVLVGERTMRWPAYDVTAVDTTAAGDAFNGALAVALAERRDIDEAGRFATAAAAISVTRPGAQPSMPSRDEVEAFLRRPTEHPGTGHRAPQ